MPPSPLWKLSSPSPPFRELVPVPPLSWSLPPCPLSTSFPSPPNAMSLPLPALMVSFPVFSSGEPDEPPKMTSSSEGPVIASLAEVPFILATRAPKIPNRYNVHRARTACSRTALRGYVAQRHKCTFLVRQFLIEPRDGRVSEGALKSTGR